MFITVPASTATNFATKKEDIHTEVRIILGMRARFNFFFTPI